MSTKAVMAQRQARVSKAIKLIDDHGPLSCAELAAHMGENSRAMSHTIAWLVKAGTHVRHTTSAIDSHCNKIVKIMRTETHQALPQEAPYQKPESMTSKVRKAILDAGIKDGITTQWVAEKVGISRAQASTSLQTLHECKELDLSHQTTKGNRKQNHYSVTCNFKGSNSKEITIMAAASIAQAMAGFVPHGRGRTFFSLGVAA